MNDAPLPRISRREAIRWVIAASGSAALLGPRAFAEGAAKPYGRDALLNETYKPGDFWPLTFTPSQRRTVTALCDLIIPADDHSPAASAVAVPDFIDEWISAPYKEQQAHRAIIIDGLKWLDQESARRFGRNFAELSLNEQSQIADDICHAPKAKPEYSQAAEFFAVMRSLTATGFYTTPVGWRDIGFVGNVALPAFPDPPPEVLERLGLKKNW
jgi:hypothetical protein